MKSTFIIQSIELIDVLLSNPAVTQNEKMRETYVRLASSYPGFMEKCRSGRKLKATRVMPISVWTIRFK